MIEQSALTRFYLTLSPLPGAQVEPILALVSKLAGQTDIASVSFMLEGEDVPYDKDTLQKLITPLQDLGIAVLANLATEDFIDNRKSFEKGLEKAAQLQCDGVHIMAEQKLLARAREVLGPDAIIGANCLLSRHFAMQMGEKGADYIMFSEASEPETDQLPELVDWWQALFEVPCIAHCSGDLAQLQHLLRLPADFIAMEPDQLQAPERFKLVKDASPAKV